MFPQASMQQGHPLFKGRGKQCLANSERAILKSVMFPPRTWNKS